MTTDLDRLAEACGIEAEYIAETGEHRVVGAEAKRAVLAALGVPARTDEEIRASLARLPAPAAERDEPPACFLSDDLRSHRAWGVACQLYGLRSPRNLGIGDFDDLAHLAETLAALGADFLGINPVHALFGADPGRFSPYMPSSRRFLNPLYIAADRLAEEIGVRLVEPPEAAALREAELVEHRAVAALKGDILHRLFASFEERHAGSSSVLWTDFAHFREDRGRALEDFALFEALSETLAARGHGAGWHGWPEAYRRRESPAVVRFAEAHANLERYHAWLQWVADRQLAQAQARARAAGMRLGLYIDFAVGVAPDGAGTWARPDSVVRGVRVGAPPDMFNAEGQDWGLAPLSPVGMARDGAALFGEEIDAATRHAGAIRMDHAMALQRLFWIPDGVASPAGGAYVRYPTAAMLGRLADSSLRYRAVVIGEDLGTVPPDFRERMRQANVLSYRVAVFERDELGRFLGGDAYPAEAIACIGTHDMPSLRGWWQGSDIALRLGVGMIDAPTACAQRAERARDKASLVATLKGQGVLDGDAGEAHVAAETLPEPVCAALHLMLARSPCLLFVLRLEDMLGIDEQTNLPGTTDEHPNWRRRMPVELAGLAAREDVRRLATAVAAERPRP